MTSRERVRRTFEFKSTDRVPFDFMEAAIWPELMAYFRGELGLADAEAVATHFDLDFRWCWPDNFGTVFNDPNLSEEEKQRRTALGGTYSDHVMERPFRNVETPADLDKCPWPAFEKVNHNDVRRVREQHPDRAIALLVTHIHPFMMACSLFGIETALMKMVAEPKVFEAFIERLTEKSLETLERCCSQVEGHADICWLMDDVASQRAMMMNPDLWRRYLKEPVRRQVEVVHEHGLFALFHSCGAVRPILPDLIDIGVDGHLTFQTTAEGMEAESIARDFGGKLAFYGGIDVQQLLTFGSEEDVRREVRKNIDAFSKCGGYIVSNAHHGIPNIRPQNMAAMATEARTYQANR